MRAPEADNVPVLGDASVVSATVADPGAKLDCYIVVGYWSRFDEWWKVFDKVFKTKERADAFAADLPRGYTHRRVFHLTEVNPNPVSGAELALNNGEDVGPPV